MGIVDKVKSVIPGVHSDSTEHTGTGHGVGNTYSTGQTAERHGAGVPSVGLGEHITGPNAGAIAFDNKTSDIGHTGTGLGTTGTTVGSTGLGTTGTTVGSTVPGATHTLGTHDTHHGHGRPNYVEGNTRLDAGHPTTIPGNTASNIAVVPVVHGGEKTVLYESHTTEVHPIGSDRHSSGHVEGHHDDGHQKKEGIIDKVKDAVGMGGKGDHQTGDHSDRTDSGYIDATPGYTSGAITGTTPGYTTGTTATGTTPGYVGSTGTTTGPTGTTPYTSTTGTDRII